MSYALLFDFEVLNCFQGELLQGSENGLEDEEG